MTQLAKGTKPDKAYKTGPHQQVVVTLSTLSMAMAFALPSQATPLIDKQPIDKTTVRFEQTRFESHRLEQVRLAEAQAQLERLRARLLGPAVEPEAQAVAPASGTYLYGQQPIPDQLGTAYFIFESQGTDIAGALYMPSSSFDCAQGQILHQQISLSVTDSYSQETYAYAMTLNQPLAEVASRSDSLAAPPNIEGFYQLPVREQDRALLAICQSI